MKKFLFALVTVVFVFSAGSAFAQTPVKIGVINFPALIERSNAGQAATRDMEKQFKGREDALKVRKNEIERLSAEFEKQSMALKQEAKQGKEDELRRKMMEYQKLAMELERDRQAASDRLFRPIFEKAERLVNEHAQKNKFNLLFDGISGRVIYADSTVDLTDTILSDLNKR